MKREDCGLSMKRGVEVTVRSEAFVATPKPKREALFGAGILSVGCSEETPYLG